MNAIHSFFISSIIIDGIIKAVFVPSECSFFLCLMSISLQMIPFMSPLGCPSLSPLSLSAPAVNWWQAANCQRDLMKIIGYSIYGYKQIGKDKQWTIVKVEHFRKSVTDIIWYSFILSFSRKMHIYRIMKYCKVIINRRNKEDCSLWICTIFYGVVCVRCIAFRFI